MKKELKQLIKYVGSSIEFDDKVIVELIKLKKEERRESERFTFNVDTNELQYKGCYYSYHNGDAYDEITKIIKITKELEDTIYNILHRKAMEKAVEELKELWNEQLLKLAESKVENIKKGLGFKFNFFPNK